MYNALSLSLCLIVLAIVFYWGHSTHLSNVEEIELSHKHSIQGIFMNRTKQQRSMFIQQSKDIFQRRRQGVSRMYDETWTKVSDRYIISLDSYATLKDDTITIYENDVPIETLFRSTSECKPVQSEAPTYSTLDQFLISAVPEEQQDELLEYITDNKHCAYSNEWNMPIGPHSNQFIAKGLFLVDKKQTTFFFLQPNTAYTIQETFPHIKQQVLHVNKFKDMSFAGTVIL